LDHRSQTRPLPVHSIPTLSPKLSSLSLHDALPISNLVAGKLLLFAHGFNIRFGTIADAVPGRLGRDHRDVDVAMVAPKAPGHREIGRAHVGNPVTVRSRMPSASCKKKLKICGIRNT